MLTQYLHMGGLERMVFNLSTELKAQGRWEARIFVFDRLPDAGPDNDLTPSFVAAGIAVDSFIKSPGFSLGAVLAIRRILTAENISVVHTHDLGALIYGVLAKLTCSTRVRLVHTQHSFVHLSRRWIYQYYERLFVRFADVLTVVSEDARLAYTSLGIDYDAIHLVPNGARFADGAAPRTSDRMGLRKQLLNSLTPLSQAALEPFAQSQWILYMARLHPIKGQDHALRLWEQLPRLTRSRCVLLFVGPESEAGRLRHLQTAIAASADRERILYLGATHCPELWLASSELALSCSEFEGMPLGPIEAAGAGLPLVLSEIPGHEILRAWSEQYPLNDPARGARIVDGILKRIADGPAEFSQDSWRKAAEIRSRYSLSKMSATYSGFYDQEIRTR